MDLNEIIDNALVVTNHLRDLAREDDTSACESLVLQRGAVMADFQRAHEVAGNEELISCAEQIAALIRADKELRQAFQEQLSIASRAWHNALGRSSGPRHNYDRLAETGCLDRTV